MISIQWEDPFVQTLLDFLKTLLFQSNNQNSDYSKAATDIVKANVDIMREICGVRDPKRRPLHQFIGLL